MSSAPLQSVRALIERLNDAWLAGRYDELEPLFHPAVVVVGSGFAGRVEGRAACIQSYCDFGAAARVEAFEPGDLTIEVWGATALVQYPFAIGYVLGETRYDEKGRELLVLVQEAGEWQVAWRTLVMDAAAQ